MGSLVNLPWIKLFWNSAILEMTFLCGLNLTLTRSIKKRSFSPGQVVRFGWIKCLPVHRKVGSVIPGQRVRAATVRCFSLSLPLSLKSINILPVRIKF